MIKYLNGDRTVLIKKDYISNRIHVEDLASIIIKFLAEKHNDLIINVSDQNLVKNYDAIKYVTNQLQLPKPIKLDYNPEKVSEVLKSFYEVNRVLKTNVIGHHLKHKMKYPDYKIALLGLTKQLIKPHG